MGFNQKLASGPIGPMPCFQPGGEGTSKLCLGLFGLSGFFDSTRNPKPETRNCVFMNPRTLEPSNPGTLGPRDPVFQMNQMKRQSKDQTLGFPRFSGLRNCVWVYLVSLVSLIQPETRNQKL